MSQIKPIHFKQKEQSLKSDHTRFQFSSDLSFRSLEYSWKLEWRE